MGDNRNHANAVETDDSTCNSVTAADDSTCNGVTASKQCSNML